MSQRIEYGSEIHEFPDDFTDADVAKALGGAPASATATPQSATPAGNYNRNWARSGVNAIPAATSGLVGAGFGAGTAGNPLALMSGGGIGWTLGENIKKELTDRFPALGGSDALPDPFASGAKGALVEAMGLPISWAMREGAPILANAGSGATKSIREQFPGVNIGREMLKTGADTGEKAASLMASRGVETDRLIGAIDAAIGRPHISRGELASTALAQTEASLGRKMTSAETARVTREIQKGANELLAERRMGIESGGIPARPASKIVNAQGQPMRPAQKARAQDMYTLAEVKQIAQSAQDAVRADLKAATTTKKSFNASPSVAKALEKGSTAAKNAMPDIAAAEQATRRAIALTQALSGSEAAYAPFKPSLMGNMSTAAGTGLGALAGSHGFGNMAEGAALGGIAGNVLSSPPALRSAAMLLNSPITQGIGQQAGPELAALLELLFNRQAATPGGQ